MKKQIHFILLFILLLTGCANQLARLEDALSEAGIENVDKIIITDVPTKEKCIIDDPQLLEEFISKMDTNHATRKGERRKCSIYSGVF